MHLILSAVEVLQYTYYCRWLNVTQNAVLYRMYLIPNAEMLSIVPKAVLFYWLMYNKLHR